MHTLSESFVASTDDSVIVVDSLIVVLLLLKSSLCLSHLVLEGVRWLGLLIRPLFGLSGGLAVLHLLNP